MVTYNNPSDYREKMQKCQEYIEALEEELRKIRVFERELPLCLELVSQAIERCRQQMSGTIMDCFNGQSDQYSEQTSSEGPVLEEFIPIKRDSSTNEDDVDRQQKQHVSHNSKIICSKEKSPPFSMKSDWLTSAQLSIKTPDPPIEEDFLSNKLVAMETNRNGYGAFHPFMKKRSSSPTANTGGERSLTCPAMLQNAANSCSADTDGGGGSKGEDKGLYNKKERRCWSPELHRRFLHALQQLGGAHVATPKQIKELMKVDGLTNDEIKSHLQKYRLHTRRVSSPTIHHNDPHPSQLVVVGRIWMPPLEYTTVSPATDNTNKAKGVFTPIASLSPSITASLYKTKLCNQQPHFDGKRSQSHSNTPSTSSMYTTTVSTAFCGS